MHHIRSKYLIMIYARYRNISDSIDNGEYKNGSGIYNFNRILKDVVDVEDLFRGYGLWPKLPEYPSSIITYFKEFENYLKTTKDALVHGSIDDAKAFLSHALYLLSDTIVQYDKHEFHADERLYNEPRILKTAEVNKGKCVGCGKCENACGNGAIKVVDGFAVVKQDYCAGCDYCKSACPSEAIEIKD